MTALSIHRDLPIAPVSPSTGDEWVPLSRAAELIDIHTGTLRRKCPALAKRGLAERRVDNSTGRRAWHLHRTYHRDLVEPMAIGQQRKPSESAETILARHTPEQLRKAEGKALAVKRFRAWRRQRGVVVTRDIGALIAELKKSIDKISARQLYQWCEIAPDCDDFSAMMVALLDQRGRTTGKTAVSDQAWTMFMDLYLSPHQLSIAHCWRVVRTESEMQLLSWPSLSRVKQLVRERIKPTKRDYHRLGRDAWAKLHAAPLQQDPDAWEAGQCWEADHSTCDLFIQSIEGGRLVSRRPVVTAWMDRRTRLLVGFHVSLSGNSDTIRASLLSALRKDDVCPPEYAWLDNGKDFASEQFIGRTKKQRRDDEAPQWDGLLNRLGIETHFALPYNHNGKARIERFFGTMHMDFDRTFESWCGSDNKQVDKKPLRKLQLSPEKLPTLDEFRAKLSQWIDWYNHRAEHAIDDLIDSDSNERLSPIEAYTRWLPARRVLADIDALSLLEQRWGRPLTVSKQGVGVAFSGRKVWYGSTHPAIEKFRGSKRKVHITYDPADTSRVRVYDDRFRFICIAQENDSYGGLDAITAEDRKAAIADRKRIERRLRERVDTTALTLTDHELAREHMRDREIAETKHRIARETGKMPDAPLRIVATGLEGQAQRVESEEAQLLAAGGEHDVAPPDDLDFSHLSFDPPEYDDEEIDLAALEAPEIEDTNDDGCDLDFAPTDDPPCESAPDALELSFSHHDDAEDDAIDVLHELGAQA